jgi:hypothetical protein
LTSKTISGASNTLSNIGVGAISATGTASSTTYLRGDGSWQAVPDADLSAVSENILPDAGFAREIGSEALPWNYTYTWNIKAAGWYMYGNGTPYTTQVIPNTGVTANQSLTLPSDTTGVLATEAYVDANSGSQQVFVQQTDPGGAGPAVWYVTDGSGNVIGKKVRG